MKMRNILIVGTFIGLLLLTNSISAQITAGVSKVNITNENALNPILDSLYVKALVLKSGKTHAVIITLDAIAIGRIGSIGNEYLEHVRSRIKSELGIEGRNVLVNASHLHGAGSKVAPDIEERTMLAVKRAAKNMVPVKIGVAKGYEDRITENHILKTTAGKGWSIRHANPLPPDEEVESVGPIDPDIGILRLDKKNGETLAVLYNFTGHPYQSLIGTTAGFPGFASKLIEQHFGKNSIAMFIQGFAGDIIPVSYKDVHSTRDQEPLGNMLGIRVIEAVKNIEMKRSADLKMLSEMVMFPLRNNHEERIEAMKKEQSELLKSLKGTSLNFKTFLPLYIQYNLHEKYPSYYSHQYMREEILGTNDLKKLDEVNRKDIRKYLQNIYAMDKLSRLQYNIGLEKERQIEYESIGKDAINLEVQALKIGDFLLVTFPAEVSVQVGLNIKANSLFKNTFVAGYTNGYIHYTPTAEQIGTGSYQDHNCLLTPEWQKIYEEKVSEMLKKM